MGLMLLIAGRRPDDMDPNDLDMDLVERKAVQTPSFIVRRCDFPRQLPIIVESVAQQHGRIDVLDLYDHASPGRQRMGAEDWVRTDDDRNSTLFGEHLVLGLRDSLSDTAQVRLLGCSTSARAAGVGSMAGRLLLFKIASLLGGRRVVLGTIKPLLATDFDIMGLRRAIERDLLFSSLAALDGMPPTSDERGEHIREIRKVSPARLAASAPIHLIPIPKSIDLSYLELRHVIRCCFRWTRDPQFPPSTHRRPCTRGVSATDSVHSLAFPASPST